MRKSFLFLLLSVFSLHLFAGGDPVGRNKKFDKEFKYMLKANDSAVGDAKLQGIEAKVDTWIDSYPRDWRVYYWKAYSLYKSAEMKEGNDKMKTLELAMKWVDRSALLYKNHADNHILKAFILNAMIEAQPEKEMKFLPDMEFYMDKCYRVNPSNPRYMLLQGIVHTRDTLDNSENAELAKKYLKGALYFFSIEEKDNQYDADPKWGKARAELLLSVFGVKTNSNALDNQIIQELDKDIAAKKKGRSKKKDKDEGTEETSPESSEQETKPAQDKEALDADKAIQAEISKGQDKKSKKKGSDVEDLEKGKKKKKKD